METTDTRPVRGRFAPSPTGRMHLGNLATALLSWLSAKSQGGRWVLRIEDLDPQRSKERFALQIEDDLQWLGLIPDEGGYNAVGACGPYRQSLRGEYYEAALGILSSRGLTYPCTCSRAEILATQAPHLSDGRIVYPGTCRPPRKTPVDRPAAARLYVPHQTVGFDDRIAGHQAFDPAAAGDIVLRRADGAWAYQLAVVVDDAAMGITEVVRGDDLLESTATQIMLYRLLGLPEPQFAHIPLICNEHGQRLSKRDPGMSLDVLRPSSTPETIIGALAHLTGLRPTSAPVSAADLLASRPLYR